MISMYFKTNVPVIDRYLEVLWITMYLLFVKSFQAYLLYLQNKPENRWLAHGLLVFTEKWCTPQDTTIMLSPWHFLREPEVWTSDYFLLTTSDQQVTKGHIWQRSLTRQPTPRNLQKYEALDQIMVFTMSNVISCLPGRTSQFPCPILHLLVLKWYVKRIDKIARSWWHRLSQAISFLSFFPYNLFGYIWIFFQQW